MRLEEIDRMPPKVREKYLQLLRSVPLSRKLEQVLELCDLAQGFMITGIQMSHPEWGAEQIRAEVIRRRLPPDLAIKLLKQ